MTKWLDKLNLRPQERRWLVMAVAVLAVVAHFWFVQPYFKEWGQTKAALEKARKTLLTYQAALAQTNNYRIKLAKLENEGTGFLTQEGAGRMLIDRIQAQATKSKVIYNSITVLPKGPPKPTEFFEEQTLNLGVNPTGDKELIDFLVAIGNSDLMVRVKDLTLSPDQGGYKLMGSMRLVASFQKKSSATVKPAGGLSSARP